MQHTMSAITAVVLAAFVGYAGAWYTGAVEGNFALLLLLATVVTGVYWVAEKLVFLPQRRAEAQRMLDEHNSRKEALLKQGFSQVEGDVEPARQTLLMQPWWLDWTAGLFPVILAVFVLRSFLFEPFKIPSGSMIPTLRVGDLILVNKFHYGVRLPVINTKIIANHDPQRGDVMVFRYPPQPSLDYIKRVIGVPGDEVAYLNKQLTVNGKPVPKQAQPEFFDSDAMRYAKAFQEQLGGRTYGTLNDDDRPAFVPGAADFKYRDHCNYTVEGVVCKVPQGHYFMMGDNRDNSLDSRYWGFVPEANIVGRAFFVWMNFGDLGRIGSFE
jgi:signal peptidase I